ncbi:MAG: hypothetical protein K2H26_06920, partial [Ruminococcus sp.]|nr:hypothetical protein [Ruminococcus sp.]
LITDEKFFDEWCSENWNEEVYRRMWGYYHNYLNRDINIKWIGKVDFQFDGNKYQKCFLNGLS